MKFVCLYLLAWKSYEQKRSEWCDSDKQVFINNVSSSIEYIEFIQSTKKGIEVLATYGNYIYGEAEFNVKKVF